MQELSRISSAIGVNKKEFGRLLIFVDHYLADQHWGEGKEVSKRLAGGSARRRNNQQDASCARSRTTSTWRFLAKNSYAQSRADGQHNP